VRSASISLSLFLLAIASEGAQQDFTVPPGLSSLVCRVRQGGNTLRELLPAVPDATLVYTFDAATQS